MENKNELGKKYSEVLVLLKSKRKWKEFYDTTQLYKKGQLTMYKLRRIELNNKK